MKYYDVIIVGSGLAGLNAALRFGDKEKKVLLVTKKTLRQSNSSKAQGGIAAVLAEEDSIEQHVTDTLNAGSFHNKKSAVKLMIENSTAAIQRLEDLGVPFARNEKKLRLTREGAHSAHRIAYVGDHTGEAIIQTLIAHLKKMHNVTVLENAFATDILVQRKICHGIQIIHKQKFQNIYASKVILATGGLGQLYACTTNPDVATGDGIGIAFRAGCTFMDMEFIQFHPTALNIPGRPHFLISEAVRGEGAFLVNAHEERFMKKHDERGELAPRDIVSRSIFEEEKNGPVYLDMRHEKREHLKKRFPTIYSTLKKYKLDLSRDLIPISPAAHYSCGGIATNLRGETNVKNLYAIGETAWTGVHGANRLASNSLLEALVFSEIVAAENITKTRALHCATPRFKKPLISEIRKIAELKKDLRNIMWSNVGIVRSRQSLKTAREVLTQIHEELQTLPRNNPASLELENMLIAADLILKAAIKRKKSLGCHWRV